MLPNVKKFVEIIAEVHQQDPVVEFGSRQVENQDHLSDLRPFFRGLTYIGMDHAPGQGVDRVVDCAKTGLANNIAGTVLICETLEHCLDPHGVLSEASRILRPDGLLIVTTPFNFPIHHLPDFWRFTPECMEMMITRTGLLPAVFFQGKLENPLTVFAVGAKTETVLHPVLLQLHNALYSLPASAPGESVYAWSGSQSYIGSRLQAAAARTAQTKQKET